MNQRAVLAVLLALGCVGETVRPGATRYSGGANAPVVQFETLEQPFSLEEIEELGKALYEYDRAASLATDELHRAGLADDTFIAGWITVPANAGHLVRFVSPAGGAVVDVALDPRSPPSVTRYAEPVPLPPNQLARWRARQLALEQPFRACTERYNTVVLPTKRDGADVLIVYLLAATTQSRSLILGGHHRIWITASGSEVLANQALSRACPRTETGRGAALQLISNFGIPRPLETHVFTSLHYEVDLGVVNEESTWLISEGQITEHKRPNGQ